MRGLFQRAKNAKLTLLLVIVNILIFASYGFQENTILTLIDLGANFAPFTLHDQPYRLVTSMFLHGNVIHLVVNMYSLWYIGSQLEAALGSKTLVGVYALTGVIASLTSNSFNLFIVSVGASGAIFGLYGYYLIYSIEEKQAYHQMSAIFGFLVYLGVTYLIGRELYFDNAAHLGGAMSGVGLRLLNRRYRSEVIGVMVAVLAVGVYFVIPRYQVQYYEAYQGFVESDQKILTLFNASLRDQDLLRELRKVEYLPDSAIATFRTINSIHSDLQSDTTTIVRYCRLRKQQIDLSIKGLTRESFIYLDSIRAIGQMIERLPPLDYGLSMHPPAAEPDTVREPPDQLTWVKQYYDEQWFETDQSAAKYYRLGQKDSSGDWHGFVEDYFIGGAIQMKGSLRRGLREGIFIYYNEDSTYSSAGRYYQDNAIGKWESFYRNGGLATEVRYENGKSYVENLWDSAGDQLVIDRQGVELYKYPDGTIQYRRLIEGGLTHGYVESYYQDGSLRFKERYEHGELIQGISYSGNGQHVYDISTRIPFPSGGYDAFYQYVEAENHLASDTIDERVVLRFNVHPSGRIHTIRFLTRFQKEYDEYAKQLLVNGPTWNPAMAHGMDPIDTYAEVTITF